MISGINQKYLDKLRDFIIENENCIPEYVSISIQEELSENNEDFIVVKNFMTNSETRIKFNSVNEQILMISFHYLKNDTFTVKTIFCNKRNKYDVFVNEIIEEAKRV